MSTYYYCQKCGGTFDPAHTQCPNCDAPDDRDAEIASLRASVERLTAERDEAIGALRLSETRVTMLLGVERTHVAFSKTLHDLAGLDTSGDFDPDELPDRLRELVSIEQAWEAEHGPERAESAEATIRELRAELNKHGHPSCKDCGGWGYVGSPPDDYRDCPSCEHPQLKSAEATIARLAKVVRAVQMQTFMLRVGENALRQNDRGFDALALSTIANALVDALSSLTPEDRRRVGIEG